MRTPTKLLSLPLLAVIVSGCKLLSPSKRFEVPGDGNVINDSGVMVAVVFTVAMLGMALLLLMGLMVWYSRKRIKHHEKECK